MRLAELPSHILHSRMRWAFRRFPEFRRFVLGALEPVYRVGLFPFRRAQGRGVPTEDEALVRRTGRYNEAAERYFADYAEPEFLLNKPFSDTALFAKHLIDVGVLVDGARLRPGDTVVEMGAGSCWLSHLLNRFGCRTIAIDVSSTALDLGKQLFERDPRTNWALDPQFVAYDGHSIPLGDAVCDRVIFSDSFHHIPNQRRVLEEVYRLLRSDGSVAMSEPGRGHASAPNSVAESEQTNVLENELVLADLTTLAEAVGFRSVSVLAASATVRHEVPARDLGRFMGGQGFVRYWKALCASLDRHHYILIYKGRSQPTTERPGELVPQIEILRPRGHVTVSIKDRTPVTVRVANLGDTEWLNRGVGESKAGWTRLGVHLYEAGAPPHVVDFDWCRAPLGRDVGPGDSATVRLDLPPFGRAGVYVLLFDLVIEGAMWFADHGTSPSELRVTAV